MPIFRASPVCVCEFGIAHSTSLTSIGFLEDLVCFLISKVKNVRHDFGLCNLLQKLIGDGTLAAELAALGGKLFLRLACKGGIDYETVDEDEDVVPNLVDLLGCTSLVLLL